MRRYLFLLIGFALGFWLVVVGGGRISADMPLTVIGAEDPVLLLPISPDVDRIVGDLRTEFERLAAEAPDPRVADSLRQFAADEALLRNVATSPVEMFDKGQAAATATPVYDIRLEPEGVTVVVATVELIPADGPTAISRDHEDGHALINRRVASRCAREAMTDAVQSGARGDDLINAVIVRLSAAGEAVHHRYHQYSEVSGLGAHLRAAERALADVPGC